MIYDLMDENIINFLKLEILINKTNYVRQNSFF